MTLCEDDFNKFGGNFFRFESEKDYDVVLANWRLERKKYSETEGEREVVVFDVLKSNGVELVSQKLTWATKSRSFLTQAKPYLLAAQKAGKDALRLLVRYDGTKKTYMVSITLHLAPKVLQTVATHARLLSTTIRPLQTTTRPTP
jgi:hypothetical protein